MTDRVALSPPPDAIRSFVAGRENPAGMNVRFHLVDGAVEAEWQVPAAFEGWGGIAHGAVAAALHDEAAINSIVYLAGQTGFTKRLDVRYLRPIRLGDRVHVRATSPRRTERGAIVASEIRVPDGAIASTAETEYVFADAAAVVRLLGRPLSPMLESWFKEEPDRRVEIALAWARAAKP